MFSEKGKILSCNIAKPDFLFPQSEICIVDRDPTQINSVERKGGSGNTGAERSKSNCIECSNLDF